MDETTLKADGWLNSLRRIGDALIGLAQGRLELFAVELQEEKLRALGIVVWLTIAFALIVAGILVGFGALGVYLWAIAGYYGLAGLALALLAAGACVLWTLHHQIISNRTPFAGTIGEFEKDRKCLRSDN